MRHEDPHEAVINSRQRMARQGCSPAELFRELKRWVGPETHIVTRLNYFRQAFRLTLADVKPLAALSRNSNGAIEYDALLNDLVAPVILKRRPDGEDQSGGDSFAAPEPRNRI